MDFDTATDEQLGVMFMKEYVRIKVMKETTSDWFLGVLTDEINRRAEQTDS